MEKSVFLAGNANTSWLKIFIYSDMVFCFKKRRYETTQYPVSGSVEASASVALEASSVSSSAASIDLAASSTTSRVPLPSDSGG
jgi:hypothetical protein